MVILFFFEFKNDKNNTIGMDSTERAPTVGSFNFCKY